MRGEIVQAVSRALGHLGQEPSHAKFIVDALLNEVNSQKWADAYEKDSSWADTKDIGSIYFDVIEFLRRSA